VNKNHSFIRVVWRGWCSLFLALKNTFPYLVGATDRHKGMTEEYPDRISARMPEDLPPRYRGFLSNDIQRCSGCRFCEETCPVDCIHIETETGSERNVQWVSVFDIDHSRCMFCGLCVEICPTKSLQHTREYEGAVYRLNDLIQSFGRGWITKELREKWTKQQAMSEALVEELNKLTKSPVGAELERRRRSQAENIRKNTK